ncbi:MAG TPA: chemotaxis protein CheX [Planctomycetaceae bacterium]|nr:chemotaxis protein CheX [Planctomycetaceae bacterium]HIQ22576.1 chemotaxis protein CheX [Planctomycetota bacterium]
MKVEYINPFLTATVTAFQAMLGWKLQRGKPFVKKGYQPEHEISGVIGLSGRARGVVVLSLSRSVALAVTGALLPDQPPAEINAQVTDAIGEMANIIAGGAKARLEKLHLSVSLPTVVSGKCHCIDFPSRVPPICIPFETPFGPMSVQVGLVETDTCTDQRTADAPAEARTTG